jgi:uncharacterized protein (TIGR00725 family)
MSRIIVGVMGPGETATVEDCANAERLGAAIADHGWATLTGGRPIGVMEAALRGARRRNGLTIGVLPSPIADEASPDADIRIVTGLGEARNVVNVLSSDVLCVCGMSAGTASEAALAVKVGRPMILIAPTAASEQFWRSLGGSALHVAHTIEEAVQQLEQLTSPRTASAAEGSSSSS